MLGGRTKRTVPLIFAAVVATAVYAYTGSNTVPSATVGEGAGAISGYTISSVAYNLNATNPQNIDSVTFTTNAAASTVKSKLASGGSTWYSCSATNAPTNTNWSCATTSPQATVQASNELRIVAVA